MKICPACGQEIPQPVGRLVCSQCTQPILRKSGGWKHGADGRPRHNDCNFTCAPEPTQATMDLLDKPPSTINPVQEKP